MNFDLKYIEDFRKILSNYVPAHEAINTLGSIELVILLGVSGSGRNTIIDLLVETGRYHFILSDTTRPPKVRDGRLEQDGVQYHFRTEEEVLQDLKDGKYLEAEVIHNQQVSGISICELEKARNSGKIPINEVDIAGTVNILKSKPDTKMFFVVPPSYDEWIRRLNIREDMSHQELSNRMATAVRALETGLSGDHFKFVINDFPNAVAQMIDVQVTSGMIDENQNQAAREIAQKLLADTKRYHPGTH
jgi:guanylate kinase